MCPGGWNVRFHHAAYLSFSPSGLCEYLSLLASPNGLHATFSLRPLSQEHWQDAIFWCYLGDFICSAGQHAPNHHISSSPQSPLCKAHMRHGEIRVMKYAAYWQKHQLDDSRTDNKGKERWSSSMKKKGEYGKKDKLKLSRGMKLKCEATWEKEPHAQLWNITQPYIKGM